MKKKNQNEGIAKKEEIEKQQNFVIELFAILYSATVESFAKKYGDKAYKISREAFIESMVNADMEIFKKIKDKSLRSYIDWLISALTAGHEYEIVESKENSIKFKFTKCPWAYYFRKIGKPEIGKFFCIADEPLVKAFNKDINFKRTKTIMDGDGYCDHQYFIDKK